MIIGLVKRVINYLLLFSFLCCLCTPKVYADRPKVAVVLSGGGAMGVAHASVLKVIEEAGIPIDMVVGTSMGAVIGGLYAYGYSPSQLDSILRAEDWMALLLNKTHRENMDFSSRAFDDKFITTIPLLRDKSEHLYGGVLSGEAVLDLFYALTPNHLDSMDFRNLPIPFACVTFDILKNKEIDTYSGVLAEAIRSSMSIPGVFSPMRTETQVLVDGGVANNFPVDIAKKMGADIVIGVTLDPRIKELEPEDVTSTVQVISRLLDKATNHKRKKNKDDTDILINVDTRGYTSASFTADAISDLLARGEQAARDAMPDLEEIKDLFNLDEDSTNEREYVEVPQSAKYVTGAAKDDHGLRVGASFRIDNEELASVLLGGAYKFNANMSPTVDAQIRFGRRSYGYLSGSIKPFDNWSVMGTYRFYYNESKLYNEGERLLDWDFHENFARLSIFRTWNYMKLTIGACWGKKRFDHLLSSNSEDAAKISVKQSNDNIEENINYYTSVKVDTRDARTYPHDGALGVFRVYYETDNGFTYGKENGLPIAEFFYEKYIPFSERLTLVPALWGRFIVDSPKYCSLGDRNMIGGIGTLGHYMPQQIPFAGVNYFEVVEDKVAAVGATARYRVGINHNFSAVLNYGRSSHDFKDFFKDQNLVGAALCYGYRTPVGPFDFNLNWSNITKKLGCWISFGFMF